MRFSLLCPAAWWALRLLLPLFPSPPAADTAAVFRCPGPDGVSEFRQRPCAGEAGERLEVETGLVGWLAPPVGSLGEAPERRSAAPGKEGGKVRKESQNRDCWQARQRLERVERRLRRGYRPSVGERLRQQRREQEAFIRRFCR